MRRGRWHLRGLQAGAVDVLVAPEAVWLLSRRFAVSYAAMLYRLSNLQVLQFEAVEELRTARPTEIAQRVAQPPGMAFDPGSFVPAAIANLSATRHLPPAWERDFDPLTGPAHLRALQAECLGEYFVRVDIQDRTSSVNEVYECVAAWVAETYPYAT